MSYGMEITTASGKKFLGINEETLMYWGKVEVSGTAVITPFNIPSSVYIDVYYYCNQTGVFLDTSTSGGFHTLEMLRGDSAVNTSTGYAYVFMKPADIPVEGYGLALYKPDGTLQWHSARPPLSFSHTVPGLSTLIDSSVVTTQVSCVRAEYLGFQRDSSLNFYKRYLSSSSISGTNTVSVVGLHISSEDGGGTENLDVLGPQLYLGCIDSVYFDTIANKGNY